MILLLNALSYKRSVGVAQHPCTKSRMLVRIDLFPANAAEASLISCPFSMEAVSSTLGARRQPRNWYANPEFCWTLETLVCWLEGGSTES